MFVCTDYLYETTDQSLVMVGQLIAYEHSIVHQMLVVVHAEPKLNEDRIQVFISVRTLIQVHMFT